MARRALLLLLVVATGCNTDDEPSSPGHGASSGAGALGSAGRSASTGGNSGRRSGSSGKSAGAGASGTGGSGTSGSGSSAGGMASGRGGTTANGGRAGTGGALAAGGANGAGDGGNEITGGAAGLAGADSSISYTTTFDADESPLSESGVWHHDGLDWTIAETAGGVAYGTQELDVPRSGPEGYNDSYAYLDGFPSDQQASAVVSLGTIDTSCTHEVEILLRWADTVHNARGYECNVAFDGSYAEIVRWNGPVGDYTYLDRGSVPGGIHDGDTVSADVVGGHVTLSVNGVVRATADDPTFTDGNPGIGFWRGSSGCGEFGDYGFTSFEASGR